MWIQKVIRKDMLVNKSLVVWEKKHSGEKTKDCKDVWKHENACVSRKNIDRKTPYIKDKDRADTKPI